MSNKKTNIDPLDSLIDPWGSFLTILGSPALPIWEEFSWRCFCFSHSPFHILFPFSHSPPFSLLFHIFHILCQAGGKEQTIPTGVLNWFLQRSCEVSQKSEAQEESGNTLFQPTSSNLCLLIKFVSQKWCSQTPEFCYHRPAWLSSYKRLHVRIRRQAAIPPRYQIKSDQIKSNQSLVRS